MQNEHPVEFGNADPIGPLNKGLGAMDKALDANQVRQLDWNLLHEDLGLPAAVLYQDKLQHNLRWMSRFIHAYGMQLAPHGKTTMAPKLFHLQLAAGAWGITLATVHQVKAAYAHGVRRILMANQLVGRQNMAEIAALLADPVLEFYCLVDCAENVRQLGEFFSSRGLRLRVLLEIGVAGGRAGVRNQEQIDAVVAQLSRFNETIALCGVEVYEGVLSDEGSIRAFLRRVVQVSRKLMADGAFQQSPFMLTGAGSAWYDVVAEEFAAANFGNGAKIILRPGCYLTHDVGAYRQAQSRILESNPVAREMLGGLVPALHIWAYVQSLPEPGRAIVGLGRRDAAFDSGLPAPALHFRPGHVAPVPVGAHWKVSKIMDQHAFMEIDPADDLRVGDMIAFDICHPCLTFDKWRTLPILDEDFRVIDIVQTFF